MRRRVCVRFFVHDVNEVCHPPPSARRPDRPPPSALGRDVGVTELFCPPLPHFPVHSEDFSLFLSFPLLPSGLREHIAFLPAFRSDFGQEEGIDFFSHAIPGRACFFFPTSGSPSPGYGFTLRKTGMLIAPPLPPLPWSSRRSKMLFFVSSSPSEGDGYPHMPARAGHSCESSPLSL